MRSLLAAGFVLSGSLFLASASFAAEPEEAPEPPEPQALEAQMAFGTLNGAGLLGGKGLKVTASSSLCEGKKRKVCHGPERLVDRDAVTAWCEGAKGDGVDESVTFEWKEPREVVALDIVPYYAKDMRRASGNGRLSTVRIEVGDQVFLGEFEDYVARVREENTPEGKSAPGCGDETCDSQDERIQGGTDFRITLPRPVKATKVRVVIVATYAGKSPDTCVSAMDLFVKSR